MQISREFVSTELLQPLVGGEVYYVGFDLHTKSRINACEYEVIEGLAIDRLGVLFTSNFLYYDHPFLNPEYPDVIPQLENPAGQLIWDTAGWRHWHWLYTASGDERVMTIGNFYPTNMVTTSALGRPAEYRAQFMFDNFCVRNFSEMPDSILPFRYVGVCDYDTLFIPFPGQFRLWNTGDTVSYFTFHQIPFEGDTAHLSVKVVDNCKFYLDSIIVFKKNTIAPPVLDTLICARPDELIDLAVAYPTLQFYDSVGTKLRYAPYVSSEYGKHSFKFKYRDSCSVQYGQVNLTIVPYPTLSLPDTILRCQGDSVLLSIPDELADSYYWNTGATERQIWVSAPGIYEATIFNVCGSVSDESFVGFEKCENCLLIPNAFSPNNDGINDWFEIKSKCPEINQFKLEIYNRWGQLVFVSYGLNNRWSGRDMNGRGLQAGTYIYRLSYRGQISQDNYTLSGEVHLIR